MSASIRADALVKANTNPQGPSPRRCVEAARSGFADVPPVTFQHHSRFHPLPRNGGGTSAQRGQSRLYNILGQAATQKVAISPVERIDRASLLEASSQLMKNCTCCGVENAEDAMRCRECGAGFNALKTPPLIPIQNKSASAGFGIRAVARIVDTLFGLAVGFLAGVLAGVAIMILNAGGNVAPGWEQRLHGFTAASLGFSILGNIAYHTICEGIHGATLGKLCCGIRVMTENGRPSTLKGALIRTLAFFIDALFFGLIGYVSMQNSPLNQRYGDVWGKTAVFKTNAMPIELQQPARPFILAFLPGVGCWMVLLAIGMISKVL